jgi:hypothetical protein
VLKPSSPPPSQEIEELGACIATLRYALQVKAQLSATDSEVLMRSAAL